MECVHIHDPNDQSFPFSRKVFEDRQVLYHGSCSSYGTRIESLGLTAGDRPFSTDPLIAIANAFRDIGEPSNYSPTNAENGKNMPRSRNIFLTPNFWGARSYATDCGGEDFRIAAEDARKFEHICINPESRAAAIRHWVDAMRQEEERLREAQRFREEELKWQTEERHKNPWLFEDEPQRENQPKRADFSPTIAAIEMLKDDETMEMRRVSVADAREQLLALTKEGYPVVYAVRVEPEWFGAEWEVYLDRWRNGENLGELVCSQTIVPERIVGKAAYPQGTSTNFSPSDCTTWSEAESLNHRSRG